MNQNFIKGLHTLGFKQHKSFSARAGVPVYKLPGKDILAYYKNGAYIIDSAGYCGFMFEASRYHTWLACLAELGFLLGKQLKPTVFDYYLCFSDD